MISKRYGRPTPVHLVHIKCHDRCNREVDNPKWSWREFKEAMEPLNYGERIFAE